jgi:hypothetical protein
VECTGWELRPRARAYPSEVDIEMGGNNRENEHEMTTLDTDIKIDTIWKGTGEVPMMMMRMMEAARWNLLEDYR